MSYIDVLLYTHDNDVKVKEEQKQLNDVFKLRDEINQEMIALDDNYTEDMWFSDIDDKVFAFKQRIDYWLKKGEVLLKLERKSKFSGKSSKLSGSKSLKSNSTSSPDHQSCKPKRKQYKKSSRCRTIDRGIVYEEKTRCRMAG